VTSAQWLALSPYLETALEKSPVERSAWLEELRRQNPTVAEELESLLLHYEEVAEEGFLERRGVELPNPATMAGQCIGVYRLVSQIGRGGMSTVWLAERQDGRFERRVAIKFLNIALVGNGGEKRFRREGKILGLLVHPHIAELIDAGVLPTGQPYLVLEHVDGMDIDRYCDEHRLDIPTRIRKFLDVLQAVAKAHANLIVHRDLKPSNVLVRKDGVVKLLDFGIAKLLEDEAPVELRSQLTLEYGQALTPQYAAPEQLTGEAVTAATDVYSLGLLLYVLLTGRHPIGGTAQTPADFVKVILEEEPRRPAELVVRSDDPQSGWHAARRSATPEKLHRILRGDLDTIVAKALKKDPSERYESVTALAQDLRRYLKNEPITARPDTVRYRAAKFIRRNSTVVTLGAVTAGVSIAGLAATVIQVRSTRAERDLAVRQLSRAERITDLNRMLLTDATPAGMSLTPSQLLEREERIVEREHYDSVAGHVEMLLSIGEQYSGQGQNANALRVLEKAYTLSRGIKEKSVRARASCVLSGAMLPVGELARAEVLFQQGLNELSKDTQFSLDRAFCLLRGSEAAFHGGNSNQAIERAESAERIFKESPVQPDFQELNLLVNLAGVYGDVGRFRESNSAFERASALMSNLGYDETQRAVTLFNDWALTLTFAGRERQAEAVYRRAIEASRTIPAANALPPVLLYNYGGVLRALGRLREAKEYSDRASAEAHESGDAVLVDQIDLQLARIYRDQRDWSRASALFSNLEPRLRNKLPPYHYAFAALASDRAQLEEARGDLPAALRLANQAIAIDEASIQQGGPCAAYLPVLLVRRSEVELKLHGVRQAGADIDRALTQLRKAFDDGTLSSHLGRAYVAKGRVLQEEGKRQEAMDAFRLAAKHLEDTLGPSHPDSLIARRSAEALRETR
jgi:serine/threonine protein kinase/tetratricopeptide (TPR) repeat protein